MPFTNTWPTCNKAKDREEFDRFMNEHRRGSRQGYGDTNTSQDNWGNNNG